MDLNKLKNYTSFTNNLKLSDERRKVFEEVEEFKEECINENRELQIAEGLDVITVMINYLSMLGLSEKEFQNHLDKLERYKTEKYQ